MINNASKEVGRASKEASRSSKEAGNGEGRRKKGIEGKGDLQYRYPMFQFFLISHIR